MATMERSRRSEVADFWDRAVEEWLHTSDSDWLQRLRRRQNDDLARWFSSYDGAGRGAIELSHGLEAFAGDLRGIRNEPRIVTLALNPGVGYDRLLSRDGIWSRRCGVESYSRCFTRSPPAAPDEWYECHRKTSHFWDVLIQFTRRWLNDPKAGVRDILNFELYPWHSSSKSGGISTPPDLVSRYILQPITEIEVTHVFAFGADWFEVAKNLRA
jgi:hypothetical protein